MLVRYAATIAVATVCLAAAPVGTAPLGVRPGPDAADPVVGPDGPLSTSEFDALAKSDPVAFLDACVRHYRENYRGFTAVLHKQERVAGTLNDPERVRIAVRDNPFAVRMVWEAGARSVAGYPVEGVLYAAGVNDGRMIVWRPRAFVKFWPTSPTGADARAASRYAVTEAGVAQATQRTLKAWGDAKRRGILKCESLGAKPVPELGGRVCHVLRRTCDPADVDPFLSSEPRPDPARFPADAFRTVTVMIDAETRVQVGSELRRADGELVGSYFFRDVELNPAFASDQFKQAGFRK